MAGLFGALVVVDRLEPERENPARRMADAAAPSPTAGILEAAQTRRIVILGLPGEGRAAWRIAIAALDSLATGPGLDAVGVPAPAEDQRAIDRYLSAAVADPGLLPSVAGRPAVLHDVYRAVRARNDALGVDRALRVVALAPEGWPPGSARSPADAVRDWSVRAETAAEVLLGGILAREPNARLLLLVDGLDALYGARPRASGGGTSTAAPVTLATLLRQRYGRQVYSVLVDGVAGGSGAVDVVRFQGTSLFDDARRLWSGEARLIPLDRLEAPPGRIDMHFGTRPGVAAELEPADVPLPSLVDAYLYPGVG